MLVNGSFLTHCCMTSSSPRLTDHRGDGGQVTPQPREVHMQSVDLFAGAGGLSCGLAMSGFRSLLANEWIAEYAETYKANFPESEMVCGDVRELSQSDVRKRLGVKEGEISLVAGGPPCQGFSVNAPIRSLDDERNHLFKDFLRVVASLKPKAVLIENVPGIVSLGNGTVVEQIYKELKEMGYTVGHRILFAGHYGVPQMRFRTIFIGIRNYNKPIEFPEPTHNAKAVANFTGAKELCIRIPEWQVADLKPQTSVWDALSDLPEIANGQDVSPTKYKTPPTTEYQKYLRKGVRELNSHYSAKVASINLERLKHIPQGGSWRDIPHDLLPAGLKRARRSDHTKRYGRLHPDALCSTILTKCDPHWGSYFHPTQDRVLSVREASRIQSFPDWFRFNGGITQQYEQIGNAVPPLLGKAIGDCIIKMLGKCK
jgi:DNA (cytosine-5)-methyltransferase 1